jgi:hypothetical protein
MEETDACYIDLQLYSSRVPLVAGYMKDTPDLSIHKRGELTFISPFRLTYGLFPNVISPKWC